MNEKDIKTICDLLVANGFKTIGNFAELAFRPSEKSRL